MNAIINNTAIEEIVRTLEIPDFAHDLATKRYANLGEWFKRPESTCARYAPHIYAQGSFRLGTVIRPITANEEYDLDVGCRLETGVAKTTHSQYQLKSFVGNEIEAYRVARQIEDE